jgi:TolB protein
MLAFVSRGELWLLNGRDRSLHAVAPGGYATSSPTFSSDGKWLAFLEQHQSAVLGSPYWRLWIARADGSDLHVVPGLEVFGFYGWSPRGDLLSVATGPESTQLCPCYTPLTLRVVAPSGSSRVLARLPVYDAAWSPDGSRIAVAAFGMNTSRLLTYPVAGGKPTIWLARRGPQKLNRMQSIVLSVAGWWPRRGIGLWIFGDGMVHNNDDTPLDLVRAPSAEPRLLGQTLSDRTTDVVSASSAGNLAVVVDRGGDRIAWQGKKVELCTTRPPTCRLLPRSPGTVTLDPAWSPDGRVLAYTEAPNVTTGPWSQRRIAAWFAAHRVLLYDLGVNRARELDAARGATSITWSRDGSSLLYVRNDALWLLPTLTGQAVRIAAPLFPFHSWPQYYAQIAWASQFAWSSP